MPPARPSAIPTIAILLAEIFRWKIWLKTMKVTTVLYILNFISWYTRRSCTLELMIAPSSNDIIKIKTYLFIPTGFIFIDWMVFQNTYGYKWSREEVEKYINTIHVYSQNSFWEYWASSQKEESKRSSFFNSVLCVRAY